MSQYPWDDGMLELEVVREFYGDKKAERSGILLINHITEGLAVLCKLGADVITQRAWCMHPIIQSDEDLAVFWKHSRDPKNPSKPYNAVAMFLAMEYRNQANNWLSDKVRKCEYLGSMGNVVATHYEVAGRPRPGPLPEVRLMLVADKIQNWKDCSTHNRDHPRFRELEIYFRAWFDALGITPKGYRLFCEEIERCKCGT